MLGPTRAACHSRNVIVLGLDSASTTGFALLDGERILESGTVDAREMKRIDVLAAFMCSRARPDLVAIEDNFLGINVNTVKVLSRIVGAWELAFAVRGVPTELVMASVWQKALLAGLPGGTKKRAATWVKATYGLKVSEDVADAIGIAAFVARREIVAARIRSAGAMPQARI